MADSNAHSRRLVRRHAAFLRGWRGSRTAAVMACVMAAANLLNCRGRGCLARLATGLCGSPRLPPWMHGGRHDNCGHGSWRGDRHYLLHGDSASLYCPGLRRLARLPPWMHRGRHDNCGRGMGWRPSSCGLHGDSAGRGLPWAGAALLGPRHGVATIIMRVAWRQRWPWLAVGGGGLLPCLHSTVFRPLRATS